MTAQETALFKGIDPAPLSDLIAVIDRYRPPQLISGLPDQAADFHKIFHGSLSLSLMALTLLPHLVKIVSDPHNPQAQRIIAGSLIDNTPLLLTAPVKQAGMNIAEGTGIMKAKTLDTLMDDALGPLRHLEKGMETGKQLIALTGKISRILPGNIIGAAIVSRLPDMVKKGLAGIDYDAAQRALDRFCAIPRPANKLRQEAQLFLASICPDLGSAPVSADAFVTAAIDEWNRARSEKKGDYHLLDWTAVFFHDFLGIEIPDINLVLERIPSQSRKMLAYPLLESLLIMADLTDKGQPILAVMKSEYHSGQRIRPGGKEKFDPDNLAKAMIGFAKAIKKFTPVETDSLKCGLQMLLDEARRNAFPE